MSHKPGGPGGKDLQDLRRLPRSMIQSFMRRSAQPAAPRPKGPGPAPARYPALAAFSSSRVWTWLAEYLRFRFGPRHAYQDYTRTPGDTGVYDMGSDQGEIRVALAGDWGTGTDEAADVARQIIAFAPHYTIHLGDVYYVGDHREVEENFLGNAAGEGYSPTRWPAGTRGSFALLGNHEMYARGMAYFDRMLPQLGLVAGGVAQGQKASFFCLENKYWRVIAIDTGYDSVGWPFIEQFVPPKCALRDELLAWLQGVVKPRPDDPRGIILLSHHQYYSSFDNWYVTPAMQLARHFTRPVLWFWGHEHRLAIYPLFAPAGLQAYGRCIGHGGMPVDLSTTQQIKHSAPQCPTPLVDPRLYANDEHLTVGMNGFTTLTFSGDQVHVEYVDLTGLVVHAEDWRADSGDLVRLDTGHVGCLTAPPPGRSIRGTDDMPA